MQKTLPGGNFQLIIPIDVRRHIKDYGRFGSGGPDLIFLLTIEKNSTVILSDEEDFVLRFAF